ncbi:MAG TPA: PfkB family carbohydrate kinase, partial [Myxococcota bacterium]|nr:PfkB family carbohydrate kinase [Myxococcota bacterium]
LFVAFADMEIYEELTPEVLIPALKRQIFTPHWVIDANLSEESIKAIVEQATPAQRIWGVGVAAWKARRLLSGFPHWQGLFLNKEELFSMSGESTVEQGIGVLLDRSCPLVVVSAGNKGVYFSEHGLIKHRPCPKSLVVDVTGAGDALVAGILYGLFKEEDLEKAIQRGFDAAGRILGTFDSFLS